MPLDKRACAHAGAARSHFGGSTISANIDSVAASRAPGSHPADGVGVRRELRSVAELLRSQPELAGRLDPPRGGTPPAGVELRRAGDGTRVLTINIHEGVPGGVAMTGANQRIEALRDVARFINAIDPDVVLVQELTRRRSGSFGADLEEQPSILAHLVEASDMVFTPAFALGWGQGETGTAVITRNGYEIDRAVNAALPDGDATQPRGAAIASVRRGAHGEPITIVGTHLAHRGDDRAGRERQLEALAAIVRDLADDGSFHYSPRMPEGFRWPWERASANAAGFAAERIVLGGDLNATQSERYRDGDTPDRILGAVGLEHAIDLRRRAGDADAAADAAAVAGERTSTKRRIDHIYARGFTATDVAIAAVPNVELTGDAPPTDHRGFIADLR